MQTTHDVKLQLEWIAGASPKAGVVAPRLAKQRISQKLGWAVAIAATAAILALAIGFVLHAPAPAPARALRVSLLAPEQHPFDPLSLVLSPDGSKLAFVATSAGWSDSLHKENSRSLMPAGEQCKAWPTLPSLAAAPGEQTAQSYTLQIPRRPCSGSQRRVEHRPRL
jgi:hypothetical protein